MGCRIGHHAWQWGFGDDAGDACKEAFRLPKCRQNPAGQPQRSEHIGQEELLDHNVFGINKVAKCNDASGIDDAVQTAKSSDGLIDQVDTSIRIAQVQRQWHSSIAVGDGKAMAVARRHQQLTAALGENVAQLTAKPSARTNDSNY